MKAFRSLLVLLCTSTFLVEAFHVPSRHLTATTTTTTCRHMSSEDFLQETPEGTQERIQSLVESHPVLLFMKGSKLFPQCGFSNTAVQILQSYGINFHTVGACYGDGHGTNGTRGFLLTLSLVFGFISLTFQMSCPTRIFEKESKSIVNGPPFLNCMVSSTLS
jgi:hypothetical protein